MRQPEDEVQSVHHRWRREWPRAPTSGKPSCIRTVDISVGRITNVFLYSHLTEGLLQSVHRMHPSPFSFFFVFILFLLFNSRWPHKVKPSVDSNNLSSIIISAPDLPCQLPADAHYFKQCLGISQRRLLPLSSLWVD